MLNFLRIFRLLRIFKKLGPIGTFIFLSIVVIGITISIVFFPGPEYPSSYTQPAGYTVTTKCVTGGDDCNKAAYDDLKLLVILWDDLEKTKSSFDLPPTYIHPCVATKSATVDTLTFWWIDCDLNQTSNQLQKYYESSYMLN